jgi:hypothetical protein
MEEYILEPTEETPAIHLKNGLIEINGRSIPEDPKKVFKPAYEWVKEYVNKPAKQTEVNLRIEYCDSSSANTIYSILAILANCRNKNLQIEMVFNWIHKKNDTEIIELGEFMEKKLLVLFNYIES